MKTFDLDEVRKFSESLAVRVSRCQNGEGFECADLDQTLQYHAYLCKQYLETVRSWARQVFAGRLDLDVEVEREFRDAGARLLEQANRQLVAGAEAEPRCYQLYGMRDLKVVAEGLTGFLINWVTPKLSVGPSPRLTANWDEETKAEIRRAVEQIEARAKAKK